MENVQRIIELYTAGLSIRKVSSEIGVSATQVRRLLQQNNIESRTRRTNIALENSIIERYKSGESSEKIGADVNLCGSTICRILKRYNIPIRPSEENKRAYKIREDFFDIIDTQEKAYLLGFLYADGNVHRQNNTIKIEVHEQDIDVLELFISNIFVENRPKIGIDRDIYRYITITSGHLKNALMKNGCVPDKTFLVSLPSLPSDLLRHFIRGVYDGDGCITVDNKSNRVRIILTGYSCFLMQIKEVFESLGIKAIYTGCIKGNDKTSSLVVGDIKNTVKVLNYLYNDAIIFLNRKYQLFKKSIEILEHPFNYANSLFVYNGQSVSANWLKTKTLEDRKIVAQCALEYFRKYGFPYQNFSESELKKDFENLKKTNSQLQDKAIHSINDAGLKIFKHYCHHYYTVKSKTRSDMVTAFNNDELLLKVLYNRMGISYKEYFNITGNMIRQGLRNSHVAFAASIFKPSLAKLIYDTYAPENATVLDFSMGFGQRMLGAMASQKVKKYIGADPWKLQIEAASNIKSFFNFNNIELYNIGSELLQIPEMVDFCFSSPPFFDKEYYSSDPSQAYFNKSFIEYLDLWWTPTVKNLYACLRNKGLFILNMSSKYINSMLTLCNNYFHHIDTIYIPYTRKHVGIDSCDNFYILEKMSTTYRTSR